MNTDTVNTMQKKFGTHQEQIYLPAGGIAGVGAKVTGALGDALAKLTFDQEFQGQRRQGDASIGQGIGGLGKVVCYTSDDTCSIYVCIVREFLKGLLE